MRAVSGFTIQVAPDLASDAEFVGVQASVACHGFSGHTTFTIARRDVQRFLMDATSLAADRCDLAVLLGGWDDADERLRLQVSRTRLGDRYVARVRIATTGPRVDQWNRVETEFVVPPAGLATFVEDLRKVFGDGAAASAALIVGS